jgi:tRNA dimethylallyltransferase
MCGGTGLYIRAFCDGLDDMVESNADLRNKITADYEKNGLSWLQKEVKEKDPLYYSKADIDNPQRLMRALEVVLLSGKPYSEYRTGEKKDRDFKILKFGLDPGRDDLYNKINKRVEKMVAKGMEEEAKAMYPHRKLNSLQTVGYTEWFDYFDGKLSRDEAIEKIKQHTRNYAKRQMTWFKREEGIVWINPDNMEKGLNQILKTYK